MPGLLHTLGSALARGPRGNRSAPRRLIIGLAAGSLIFALALGASLVADRGASTGATSAGDAAQSPESRTPSPTPVPENDLLAASPDAPPAAAAGERARVWGNQAGSGPRTTSGSDAPGTLQVGATLVGVIALLVATAFVLRRIMRRTRLVPRSRRELELLDVLPIGPKRFVYLVAFRGRTLVLGASADSVALLAEYGEDEWAPAEAGAIAADARTAAIQGTRTVAAGGAGIERPEPARPRTSAADMTAGGRMLPPGTHRVPPAFRHLVAKALEGDLVA